MERTTLTQSLSQAVECRGIVGFAYNKSIDTTVNVQSFRSSNVGYDSILQPIVRFMLMACICPEQDNCLHANPPLTASSRTGGTLIGIACKRLNDKGTRTLFQSCGYLIQKANSRIPAQGLSARAVPLPAMGSRSSPTVTRGHAA